MANLHQNGSGRPDAGPDEQPPLPVPELDLGEMPRDLAAPPAPQISAAVTDDDRNRFGVLLDHAVERGLLGPGEYQVRLRELAQATSIEEMTEIVSVLPAFGPDTSPAKPPGSPARPPDVTAQALAFGTLPTPTQPRRPPWVLLIVVVVLILVALVALAVVAAHVVHSHNGGSQSARVALSVLRL